MPVHDDQHPHHTDALLTAAGRGDLRAFAEFYDLTAAAVFGVLRKATTGHDGNTHDTEQATKRVYLTMWRTAPCFAPATRSAYSTLLFVARRELADHIDGTVTSRPR